MDTTIIKKEKKQYIEAVGRRKTSVARIRITETSKAKFIINNKDADVYFSTNELKVIIRDALSKSKLNIRFSVSAIVSGGGVHSQAEAIRHGVTRALVTYDEELRSKLKKLGYLKRDPRMKERKKFGLKKARKSPQWSKR